MANSFMLAPGAPTAQELAQRIFVAEQALETKLRGADLAEFHARQDELRQESLNRAGGPPEGDAKRYGRLTRRWQELEELLRKHRLAAPPSDR